VKKVVEGGTTPQGGWSFTVKDSQNQQVTTFTLPENGNYEKTISGLTPGETYTVTETNVLGPGWSTTWQVEGGSSGSGQSASLSAPGTITFTNTYTPVCEGCTERTVTRKGTYEQGGKTKDYAYTVTSSATCAVVNGEVQTTYTYTVQRVEGPEISHFDVVVPSCITKNDIISSNPSYSSLGQDGSCKNCSVWSNVIKWEWKKSWGDEKTFTITIKGQSTGEGHAIVKTSDNVSDTNTCNAGCLLFQGVCAPACE
jgi:hypothetical protein